MLGHVTGEIMWLGRQTIIIGEEIDRLGVDFWFIREFSLFSRKIRSFEVWSYKAKLFSILERYSHCGKSYKV